MYCCKNSSPGKAPKLHNNWLILQFVDRVLRLNA